MQMCIPQLDGRLQRLRVGDGKDAEKPFSGPEVVVSNGGVVFLPGRVEDVDLSFLAVQDHSLPVRVGFCRFVVFDELNSISNPNK